MTVTSSPRAMPGRPGVTTHAEIEKVAFRLFAQRGFEKTTLDALAAELGVGRRTIFRYYDSKNDIPWGEFGASLEAFRGILASMPHDIPLREAIHRGVRAFNDFDADSMRMHRQRMALILSTPALQAHSVHQYSEWRRVISDYVADRLDLPPTAMLPKVIGHVCLALAISAYEKWLADETAALLDLIEQAMDGLRHYMSET